jgi:hypothetical protein
MLTDPRAGADQNSFVHCLVGLAGLARVVHALAADQDRAATTSPGTDSFAYLLLGVASLGEATERLAGPAVSTRRAADPPCRPTTPRELLR